MVNEGVAKDRKTVTISTEAGTYGTRQAIDSIGYGVPLADKKCSL